MHSKTEQWHDAEKFACETHLGYSLCPNWIPNPHRLRQKSLHHYSCKHIIRGFPGNYWVLACTQDVFIPLAREDMTPAEDNTDMTIINVPKRIYVALRHLRWISLAFDLRSVWNIHWRFDQGALYVYSVTWLKTMWNPCLEKIVEKQTRSLVETLALDLIFWQPIHRS